MKQVNDMKTKLSRYWWSNLYFMSAVGLIAEGIMMWFIVFTSFDSEAISFMSIMMPVVLIIFYNCALTPWRFLMTMKEDNECYRSYLFGKEICKVYKDRMIYYAIVEFEEHLGFEKRYIAVSNAPFQLRNKSDAFIPLRSDRFIDYYDRSKQILYCYDVTVADMFPIEKWTCVGEQVSKKG